MSSGLVIDPNEGAPTQDGFSRSVSGAGLWVPEGQELDFEELSPDFRRVLNRAASELYRAGIVITMVCNDKRCADDPVIRSENGVRNGKQGLFLVCRHKRRWLPSADEALGAALSRRHRKAEKRLQQKRLTQDGVRRRLLTPEEEIALKVANETERLADATQSEPAGAAPPAEGVHAPSEEHSSEAIGADGSSGISTAGAAPLLESGAGQKGDA
jgi:hypothetical protein